jgi:hypothetical protein
MSIPPNKIIIPRNPKIRYNYGSVQNKSPQRLRSERSEIIYFEVKALRFSSILDE